MTTFKDRLKEIKQQRIDSEQLILNSNIDKLVNFDIEQALIDNESTAKKDLKKQKIWAGLDSGMVITSVGAIALGTTGVLGATVGAPAIALGALALGVFKVFPFWLDPGAPNTLHEGYSVLFKNVQKHNMDMVETQISNLRANVENAAVNQKTTVSDCFNAAKETVKSKFSEMMNNIAKKFQPLSPEDISDRIQKMKERTQLDQNLKNKLKIS